MIRKLIEYSLKNTVVKEMLSLAVFEILMFEGRLVLTPTQWVAENERVKVGCFRSFIYYVRKNFRNLTFLTP